jgi:acetyltransferase-like isoleucine patch superfamily enzyme
MTTIATTTRAKTQHAVTGKGSALRRYQEVVVGRPGLAGTLYFEFCCWLTPVPGALGLALRQRFWPRLFGSCGKGVVFGTGIVLRHPHRIHLGDRVVVSENCILDARSDGSPRAMVIGDDAILSNGVVVSCKGAGVEIGPRTGFGPYSCILAADGGDITVGADCAIGPRVTLVGGGHYHHDRTDLPIWRQGIRPGDRLILEEDIWVGAGATALGGVRIGRGSIAAAGATLTRQVEPYTITGGVPARPIRRRVPDNDETEGQA